MVFCRLPTDVCKWALIFLALACVDLHTEATNTRKNAKEVLEGKKMSEWEMRKGPPFQGSRSYIQTASFSRKMNGREVTG